MLTTNQAAKRLKLTPGRVRQLCREGAIDAQRIGRDWLMTPAALATWKATRRPPGNPNWSGIQRSSKRPDVLQDKDET